MPRGGSKPGERRGGRKPGGLNKRTLEQGGALSELAKQHSPAAMSALVHVATKGASEAARVTAATAILDRGYGRPMQTHEHGGTGGGPIKHDLSGLADEQLEQLKHIMVTVTVARRDQRGNPQAGGEAER